MSSEVILDMDYEDSLEEIWEVVHLGPQKSSSSQSPIIYEEVVVLVEDANNYWITSMKIASFLLLGAFLVIGLFLMYHWNI